MAAECDGPLGLLNLLVELGDGVVGRVLLLLSGSCPQLVQKCIPLRQVLVVALLEDCELEAHPSDDGTDDDADL
eukprot:10183788-Alexandrium_andersonii.AAC.1